MKVAELGLTTTIGHTHVQEWEYYLGNEWAVVKEALDNTDETNCDKGDFNWHVPVVFIN